MPDGAQGMADHRSRVIGLSLSLEPNGQVAVLVHELAHVHGAHYRDFGRAGAEVVAETAAYVALSAAVLDTGSQAVPYVSGWAEATPADPAAYAGTVHRIAGEFEAALGLDHTLERRLGIEVNRAAPAAERVATERSLGASRGRGGP